jgi:hypothetical protein
MRIASILVFALMPYYLAGQDTRGTISGTVTYPQGSSIAGAAVQVTNGYYEAPLLTPGSYSVSVESSGFKKSLQSGITLGIGEQLQINMPLEVGGTTESVTITAKLPFSTQSSGSTGRAMTDCGVGTGTGWRRVGLLCARQRRWKRMVSRWRFH